MSAKNHHTWRFFRAGGFDQVRLDSGADLLHLDELDQKLWVALACPTHGLEFDAKTLELIDTDHDGRIRATEIIAAAKWAGSLLKNPDDLLKSSLALPLDAINTGTPEGAQLHASARQILINLGRTDAASITAEDTADTAKIFSQTKFNGDGILPPDASDDPQIQAIINDIIACLGSETDRSGKPGISQAKLDLFFAAAEAFASWNQQASAETVMTMGPNTPAAATAIKAVAAKIEDFFARCRLASFDPRAVAAVNLTDAEYTAVAAKNLTLAGGEFAGLPLARVEPGRALPLTEGINPGWRSAVEALRTQVVKPALGDKTSLTEAEWAGLVAKFAPYDTWLSAKAGATVEKLGLPRIQEILAYKTPGGSGSTTAIGDLIAKDKALEPEANAISQVDRLIRYHRDLYKLLNNFVSFRDFYGRRDKAVFQAGRLYLDQRSCDLCIRVEDPGRHGLMAHLAYTYLAYCDLSRKATGEKMTVACAFTAGDSDNLMVGRNGVFYDRQGRDWDATITKIIEHPISIRQAFWAPYKRAVRFVGDMIAKRAAAADAAAQSRLQSAAADTATAASTGKAPPPPPPAARVDVGAVAAMGVAFGALSAAFATFMAWLTNVPMIYLPLYFVLILLLISTPAMILAALKLRQRNLGPILDANGWAVNAKAKINIPFGGSLTQIPKLPPGSQRDMVDPYAESHKVRNRLIAAAVILLVLLGCWYFGLADRYIPGYLPKSPFTVRMEVQAQASRDAEADGLLKQAADALKNKAVKDADAALTRLEGMQATLSAKYKDLIEALKAKVEGARGSAAVEMPATLP